MPAMMRRLFFLVVCLPSFVYAESIPFLYEQANAVLSRSDYVSGAYYLNRIMDSPEWASYPGKVNVLGRMGGLHESQADFETAARYYKQIYDELHDQPDHPQQSFYRYRPQRCFGIWFIKTMPQSSRSFCGGWCRILRFRSPLRMR